MQYLVKVELQSAPLWRLIALDGGYSLAQAGQLIATAFGYAAGERSFKKGEAVYSAGSGGEAQSAQDLTRFDSLDLKEGDCFEFCAYKEGFVHKAVVMRCEEHLYCLMPSCLVGSGLVPEEFAKDEAGLAAYLDAEEAQSLDLRECNHRIRAFSQTLNKVQEVPVDFAHC